MKQLAELFAQYGVQTFLNETHTPLALVAADGRLLEWNPAFERLAPSPDSDPQQLTPPGFSRQLIRLTAELSLLCFEPDWEAQQTEFLQLQQRLVEAQKALELKQIDLESVLVQADEVSHTDALTFLPNRRQIIADLQREVETSREQHEALTIFMLDLDHFKRVNDTYGHAAGDQVLRSLSNKLQTAIRQSDKLGRYGGEEFLLLLPGTSLNRAIKMAERLLKLTRKLKIQLANGQTIQITISLGIAEHQVGQENWEELLKRADDALYQSKNQGRDQWSISSFEILFHQN